MRVLMVTQRVDDDHDILGFTSDWIAALAYHVDRLDVLTAYAGEYELPENVTVHSYGKERGYPKWRRIATFENYCARLAPKVDAVFAHMIPQYVLAGWPWFWVTGTPVVLWYAHSSVTWDLKVAHALVDRIVTATAESVRLPSDKVQVLGHGIDTERFSPGPDRYERGRLLGVGRLDPVKNFETLIEAVGLLTESGLDVSLRIVGEPAQDPVYLDTLRERVAEVGVDDSVTFPGAVPHEEIVGEYRRAGVFLNASDTGSLDKTEVEAMACGTPVVSSNDSYAEMVAEAEIDTSLLTFPAGDAQALATNVERLLDLDSTEFERLCRNSRHVARTRHDVDTLMGKLCDVLTDVNDGG